MIVCVYCNSHAPAILMLLSIPGFEGQNAKLLFWFVTVVELSDVMQYVWGKLCGRRKIAPTVSPGKTWEGFLGGGATTVGIGAAFFTTASRLDGSVDRFDGLRWRSRDVRDQA